MAIAFNLLVWMPDSAFNVSTDVFTASLMARYV